MSRLPPKPAKPKCARCGYQEPAFCPYCGAPVAYKLFPGEAAEDDVARGKCEACGVETEFTLPFPFAHRGDS